MNNKTRLEVFMDISIPKFKKYNKNANTPFAKPPLAVYKSHEFVCTTYSCSFVNQKKCKHETTIFSHHYYDDHEHHVCSSPSGHELSSNRT